MSELLPYHICTASVLLMSGKSLILGERNGYSYVS